MALETAMNKGAPSAWRGVPTRENIIQGLLYPLLDKDEQATRALFDIIKASPFYHV